MAHDDESAVLPAESVGAQLARWQLPQFDTAGSGLHTAGQLDEIEAAAYQDGFARGQAEGFAAGQRSALQQAQRLQALIAHIARPLEHLEDEIGQALVELAAGIARRLLRDELLSAPERVVALVREALAALPPQLRSVRLSVHPDDLALLREQLTPPRDAREFEIVADATLARGDCRVFADSALIDGRLDARVRVVAQALTGDGA